MPDSPPSTSPAPRIAETAAGKILAGLLALFYIFLATTAAGGEWHTLFLPACFLGGSPPAVLLLYSPGIQDSQPRTAGLAGPGSGRRLFPCPGMVFPLVLL